MAGKYFGIPFALSGDRTAIPDAAQPDGSVSFTQGFTLDYELENTDPNYKPVPREETNALYYDITEAIGIVQKQGFADWTLDAAPYPVNAFVRHNDIVWRNTVAGNSAEPGTDATWVNETIPATDYLNTRRIDVASASTVDLTALAPDTRHINITGTTTIAGFTVAAGRCYFVRFAGALTLTNSASLVTQTGADIVTNAGDTCIIRATAANVVEVLCYKSVKQPTVGTAIATTSGTAHDFTGIPSWASRITLTLNGVSLNNADQLLVQLGAGSIENTGYVSRGSLTDSALTTSSSTSGFIIRIVNASDSASLVMTIARTSGNSWVAAYVGSNGLTGTIQGGGNKTLSGVLDRIRLTSSSGAGVFDAGQMNIMYEG